MKIQPRILLFLFLVAFAFEPIAAVAKVSVDEVRVKATTLTIVLSDGRSLTGPELTGIKLSVADGTGGEVDIRIDGAHPDQGPHGVSWLYDLKAQDASGVWLSYCASGPDGRQLGFPTAGWMDATGSFHPSDQSFTFSCTGGAVSKCIRMGYAPWVGGAVTVPTLNRFRACTRMVRADYCGTGQTHTKNATPINVYDLQNLRRAGAASGMRFEAAWAADGAICVAKTRWDDLVTLEQLQWLCGEKFAGRVGALCQAELAHQLPGAFLFNESFPSE